MRQTILVLLLCFITFLTISETLYGQSLIHQESIECQPTYGHYWRSDKWGWYGAKKVVRTPAEAREILEKFFMLHRSIKIGRIRERAWFFEAEIINRRGVVIDLVLIDKRTGRIRSKF